MQWSKVLVVVNDSRATLFATRTALLVAPERVRSA